MFIKSIQIFLNHKSNNASALPTTYDQVRILTVNGKSRDVCNICFRFSYIHLKQKIIRFCMSLF